MTDYEDMDLPELEEAYQEVLNQINQNDTLLAEHAQELSRLTQEDTKGDSLFCQQSIRWDRVTTLINKVESIFGQNNAFIEELQLINWHYDNKSGG